MKNEMSIMIPQATVQVMALAELKQDNLYTKIPNTQKHYYINESVKIGQNVAKNIKHNYRNKSIKEICELHNLKINIIENKQISKFLKLRAEYLHYDRQINIYKSSIEKMMQQFAELDIDLTYEEIVDIHLAHEFFHYLEFSEIGITSDRLKPINIKSFLHHNRTASILKTREIAAHTFCYQYLNLNIHPKFLDYLFLLSLGEIEISVLSAYLQKLQMEIENEFKGGVV